MRKSFYLNLLWSYYGIKEPWLKFLGCYSSSPSLPLLPIDCLTSATHWSSTGELCSSSSRWSSTTAHSFDNGKFHRDLWILKEVMATKIANNRFNLLVPQKIVLSIQLFRDLLWDCYAQRRSLWWQNVLPWRNNNILQLRIHELDK